MGMKESSMEEKKKVGAFPFISHRHIQHVSNFFFSGRVDSEVDIIR